MRARLELRHAARDRAGRRHAEGLPLTHRRADALHHGHARGRDADAGAALDGVVGTEISHFYSVDVGVGKGGASALEHAATLCRVAVELWWACAVRRWPPWPRRSGPVRKNGASGDTSASTRAGAAGGRSARHDARHDGRGGQGGGWWWCERACERVLVELEAGGDAYDAVAVVNGGGTRRNDCVRALSKIAVIKSSGEQKN